MFTYRFVVVLIFEAAAAHKTCLHADVWNRATGSYNLSECSVLNATSVAVDAKALSVALMTQGTELVSLRLVSNEVGADGMRVLAGALAEHRSLQLLHIELNNLSSDGAEVIVRALRNNRVLTSLTISRCDLRDGGAVGIAELLRGNSVLTELNLEMNDISPPGVAALAGALQDNDALRSLSIGINPIFPAGAAQLAKALRTNTVLQKLNVRYSGLQDGGMVSLAHALQENRVLRDLDVWANAIGDVGVAAMGHMLKENDALERLNLWENNISDVGIEALLKGLTSVKTRLRSVHLGRNTAITDASAVALQRVMYANEALTLIDFGIGGTAVEKHFELPLLKACECNELLRGHVVGLTDGTEEARAQRRAAADCRKEALKKMPLRVSVKEMMRAQGVDISEQRKSIAEKAKRIEDFNRKLEALDPEERREARRMIEGLREMSSKQRRAVASDWPKEKMAKLKVDSPHQQHIEGLRRKASDSEKEAQGLLGRT